MDDGITTGSIVLIKQSHLHGIAGEVVGANHNGGGTDGEYVIKLIDDGYRGNLVQFPASELVLVRDLEVLKLGNHERIL